MRIERTRRVLNPAVRPNVLCIVLDTARADAFEPYGAPEGSSPVIAQLARGGVALPSVFATAPWTLPSHLSMLTGRLPRSVVHRAAAHRADLSRPAIESQGQHFLSEVLRRAGYSTLGVSANYVISPRFGFATGFDEFFVTNPRRQAALQRKDLRGRLRWALEGVHARVDDGAAEAEGVLRRWLDRRPSKPFFGFVNLMECHSPYLPPRPYNDLSPLNRFRATAEARRHLNLDSMRRAVAGALDIPPEALARMRHLYARSIRSMDDWLGRVLEALQRKGLLEDTLVIVTSDHGENFGEGGLIHHGYSLDNRLTRVPFVMSGPGASSSGGVQSLAGLPSLIAEAVGLEEHPWWDGRPAGAAVAQFDPPYAADDPQVRDFAKQWELGEQGVQRLTSALTSATDGRLKLVRRGEREELYDLEADPLELTPLAPDGAASGGNGAVASLRAALEHPAVTATSAPASPADPPRGDMAELEDRMRLLGYL